MRKTKSAFIFAILIFILFLGITIPSYGATDVMSLKDIKDLLRDDKGNISLNLIKSTARQDMNKEEIDHIVAILLGCNPPSLSYQEVYYIDIFLRAFYSNEVNKEGALYKLEKEHKDQFNEGYSRRGRYGNNSYWDLLYNSDIGTSLSSQLIERATYWSTRVPNGGSDGQNKSYWENNMNTVIQYRRDKKVGLDSISIPSSAAAGQGNTGGGNNDEDHTLYGQPKKETNANSGSESIDDIVGDADAFIESGDIKYTEANLQSFSRMMYDILFSIGVVIAVIVGAVIGLKLMTETSAEAKAETTKLLIPYLVGCVVVFGGFAIWKIAIEILSKV